MSKQKKLYKQTITLIDLISNDIMIRKLIGANDIMSNLYWSNRGRIGHLEHGEITITLNNNYFMVNLFVHIKQDYIDLKKILEENHVNYNLCQNPTNIKQIQTANLPYNKLNLIPQLLRFV